MALPGSVDGISYFVCEATREALWRLPPQPHRKALASFIHDSRPLLFVSPCLFLLRCCSFMHTRCLSLSHSFVRGAFLFLIHAYAVPFSFSFMRTRSLSRFMCTRGRCTHLTSPSASAVDAIRALKAQNPEAVLRPGDTCVPVPLSWISVCPSVRLSVFLLSVCN